VQDRGGEDYTSTGRGTVPMIVVLREEQVATLVLLGIQVHRDRELPERDVGRRVVTVAVEPASRLVVAGDQNPVYMRNIDLKGLGDFRGTSAEQRGGQYRVKIVVG